MESIEFFSEDTSFEVDQPEQVKRWLATIIESENKSLEHLNIIFCSDDYLYRINVDYLGHDTLTDIITFPYQSDPIEGDLFISVDRLKDNAQTYQTPFHRELLRVMAHGVLHLIGFSDKSPEEKLIMTSMENKYMATGPAS